MLYEPKMTNTLHVLEPIGEAGDIDGYGMQARLAYAYPTIDMLRDQIEQLKLKAQTKTDLRLMLKTISDELKNYDDSIVKYNETAVRKVVECVKVISKTEVELTFKGGFDMMVEVEK